MKLILLATLFLAANSASFEDIILQEWRLYKIQFGKSYDTPAEDLYRMRIFADNKHDVAAHNLRYLAGEESYEMGINQFSDMLPEEVDNIYNGFNKQNRLRAKEGEYPVLPELDGDVFVPPPHFQAPNSVNWVEKGAVTEVRNQGKCGSCYSFAAIGALEGRQYIKTKKMVPLSMQNIIDCSSAYGNSGCNGGSASSSFNYIKGNKGVNDYDSYPYEAQKGKCRFDPQKVAGTCSGYVQIPTESEDLLRDAVAMGPVAISIDATLKSFQQYKGGVYSDPKCDPIRLVHAVLAVGYGTDPATKKDYWLIKNSWGSAWGESGYIRIARNANNMCGVATRGVYPKI